MNELQHICSVLAAGGAFGGTDLLNDDGQPVFKNGARVRVLAKKDLAKLSNKVGVKPEALLAECFVVPYADTDCYRVIGGDIAAFLSVKICLELFQRLWIHNDSALCISMLQVAYREDDRNLMKLIAATLSDAETLAVLEVLGKRRFASKEKTLYRTDMLDTALLHEWSLQHGQSFLADVVLEAIGCICRLPLAFEVESSRALSPLLLAGALQNIKAVCHGIVQALRSSKAPPMLQAFLHQAHQAATAAGGDAAEVCSTIVVLRILTPALLDPTKFGLVPIKLHKVQLRGLLLVAKVMQQIANGVTYTEGSVLYPLNDFVMEQHLALRESIVSISLSDPIQLDEKCSGRLQALQKVLAHWPKYVKLTTMNLGLGRLDPGAQTDDPVARFVIRFHPVEEGIKSLPAGMLSAMPTKKKISIGARPTPSRSNSPAGRRKSLKTRGSRLAVNNLKKKSRSVPEEDAKDRVGIVRQSSEGNLVEDAEHGSDDHGGTTTDEFSSEVQNHDPETSISEIDDPSVALAHAFTLGTKLQKTLGSETQKAQMQEMLSKIDEVVRALEFANATFER